MNLGLKLCLGANGSGVSGSSAPSAFTAGQWTLADSPSVDGDKLTLNITALPSDGGSAITALQFKVDPGTWQTMSGTGTGARTITVLAEALAAVQVRAVNAIGNGAASDTKAATPTALAGPTNSVAPAMTGTFAVGEIITVSNGTWSVTPDVYERRWTYGSTLIGSATASTYTAEEFTFGTTLFAEVRCKQTAGAWSNWVTATGSATVEADPQDVIWASEFTSYSVANPRSITTPAVSQGDCIVFMVKASAGSLAGTFVQGDFNIGTMRFASTTANGEAVACVTHVCPTTEAGGLNFQASLAADTGAEKAIIAVNIGPHVFSSIAGTSDDGSGLYNFNTPTAPRNAKVFWGHGHRNGGVAFTASPTTPAKSTSPPYAAGGNFDSGDSSTFFYFVRTQAAPGTVASQSLTPGSYTTRKHFVATFTPQIVNPAPPAGKYIADGNGAGIARTSTISSMVTDGVTLNLSASRKVGNYISNNLQLGTLFIYDTGAGVTVSSHTGTAAWKNPTAIIEDANSQPWVSVTTSGPGYDAGLLAATPISLVSGDVLVISVNQAVDGKGSYVSKFVTVHVVGTIPYDDEFAPPYCWDASLGARPRFRFSDWNQGTRPLPSLAAQSNAPALATVDQTYNRRTIDLTNSWKNYTISASLHQPLYGRDMMEWEKDALAVICSDYTLEQKKPSLIGFLQRGIDTWGVYKTGKAQNAGSIWYKADGGQKAGRKLPIIFAGFMLGNNAMRDVDSIAALADFQEDGMPFYVTQTIIDHTQNGGWDGGTQVPSGSGSAPYVQGMLDGQSLNYPMPDWCGKIYDDAFTLASFNAHWDGHAYRFNGFLNEEKDWTAHVLLATAMNLETYWGGSALFDYVRRHNNIQRYGVDPWILAGGAVSRYTMVAGAPGAGDRAPPSDSTGWAARMYWAHINTTWPYPW